MTERTCSVEGCDLPTGAKGTARGLCSKHYNRLRRNGDPTIRSVRVITEACTVDGCDGEYYGRGFCVRHWTNWSRHGEPEPRKRGEVRDGKKLCSGCGEDLALDRYGPRSTGDGVRARCLPCERADAAARFEANPDAVRRYSLAWQKRWPEKVRARQARRRERKTIATLEDVNSLEVFERDDWRCALCGQVIDPALEWPDPMSPSIDHRVPLAVGGEHSMANTQATHLVCNLRKGSRLVT